MSTHTGVSCDSCMISNFPGRRYKCLVCVNYDLCGTCHDAESESKNHKNNHPMQCLLTEAAADIFYSGETSVNRCVSSLTCPYCAQTGFTTRTLFAHCIEKHPAPSIQSKTEQVMCPICVTSSTHRSLTRFTLLADHIATVHDDGSLAGGDDLFASSLTTQTQRNAEEEEDSDEEEADEDEEGGLTLNDHDHQAFVESEQRRQEIARQRLIHASSAAAAALHSNSNNSNTQRRPLSRQTAIRIARGGFRNHFNNLPYGSSSRGGGGGNTLTSTTSSRNANSSNTTTNPQTISFHDTFALPLGADPMLDYVSQLVTNQTSTTGNWSFLSPFPVQQPTSTNPNIVDYARFQQALEAGENASPTNSLRASLLNAKQKRTSQNQQQSSSPQTVILGNTPGQDLPTWHQQLSNLQRTMNSANVFGDNVTPESNTNPTSIINPSLKHVQQSQRDSNSQSLLEKMLKCEVTVNKDEKTESNRTQQQQQQQNRLVFVRSLILSLMTMPKTDDKNENPSALDKENQL